MKIKKKNLTRLASLSAVGAGALAVTAKDAHAGIVYTVFAPPNVVTPFAGGSSLVRSFTVNPIFPPGPGGFQLFGRSFYTSRTPTSRMHTSTTFLKIAIQALGGLQFQSAPGPGFMWNNGSPGFSYKNLRSKSIFYRVNVTTQKNYHYHSSNATSTYTIQYNPHFNTNSTYFNNFTGDKFLLFKFNPTGSQDLFGWLHLYGDCGCGLDTIAVDMAFDDAGNLIAAAQTDVPEPATAIPTGLGALALGASGIRRWRKSRKQAA